MEDIIGESKQETGFADWGVPYDDNFEDEVVLGLTHFFWNFKIIEFPI